MSGTHRDLLFGSKRRCFECKNHRWGLGPIETSNSDARQGVLHAENHSWVLGPIETCNFGPKVAVLHEKNTDEGWNHIDLSFCCKSRHFECTKRQVMSGTHRDLLFRSISRCFASKNHTWGLGPMETSNSDTRHAVLQAENHRWSMGPIETCYSGPEVAVLHAKTTGGVYSPAESCNSSPKVAVFHAQNHRWELQPI